MSSILYFYLPCAPVECPSVLADGISATVTGESMIDECMFTEPDEGWRGVPADRNRACLMAFSL